jgi:hypothetical protein
MQPARYRALKWGMALAAIPAVLFFPAFAALSICPPSYGPMVMKVLIVVFLFSWSFAIGFLLRARNLNSGDMAVITAAWMGISVSAVGIAFTVFAITRVLKR